MLKMKVVKGLKDNYPQSHMIWVVLDLYL